jgi:hypothetical protein
MKSTNAYNKLFYFYLIISKIMLNQINQHEHEVI